MYEDNSMERDALVLVDNAEAMEKKKDVFGMKKVRDSLLTVGITAAAYLLFAFCVYESSRLALNAVLMILFGVCIVCGVMQAAIKESVLSGISVTLIPYGAYCLLAYSKDLFSLKITYFAVLYTGLMCVIDSVLCFVRQTHRGEELLSDIHDLRKLPSEVLRRHLGVFLIYVMIASTAIAVI